jgi:hypothetical protein
MENTGNKPIKIKVGPLNDIAKVFPSEVLLDIKIMKKN